jgi:hypothetical protein
MSTAMADEKSPAVIDPAKLLEELDKLLGVDEQGELTHIPIPALPRGMRFMWGWRTRPGVVNENGKDVIREFPTMFIVGQPWPFADGMTIIAMFKDDDEVRAYALGNRPANTGERLAPTRYSIDKRGPNIFSESMPIEIFKAELAAEYQALEEETMELEDFEEEEETPPQPNGEAKTPAPATS